MAAPRWPTAERGLGGAHQAARAKALSALADGDPCFRCELRGVYHPMWRAFVYWVDGKPRSAVLDLDDYPGRRFGGPQVKRLSYRACNRSHGAQVGNAIRAAFTPKRGTYTRW